MRSFTSNNRGNAVVIAVVAGALSLAGLALILSQVSQFTQQVGQAEQSMAQSGQDSVTLFYLQKKFAFGKTVIPATDSEPESIQYKAPDWYPEFYPTPSELASSPKIIPIISAGDGALPASKVPLFMVTKKKNSSGECISLDFPEPKSQIKSNEDCEFINLSPDKSSLGAIQNQSELSKTDNLQLSIIGVPELSLLTESQKEALFRPGFEFPLTATRGEPVKFVKYGFDESNPRVFSKVVVQTNSVGAIIPVEIPPTPKCRLSLDRSVQQPLELNSDRTIKLNLEVEQGIADTVTLNLANHRETSFDFNQFDRQRLNNFERLTPLKADGFNINLLASDKNDITQFVAGHNGNSRVWNIEATVTGFDGSTESCSTSLAINAPLPPLCTVSVNDPTTLKGNLTDVEIDCATLQGGPVRSITIDGSPLTITVAKTREKQVPVQKTVRTNSCLRYFKGGHCAQYKLNTVTEYQSVTETYHEQTSDLSLANSSVFKGKYLRKTDANETFVVIAMGPGGSRTIAGELGNICPYNDKTFRRKEFGQGELFSDRDKTEKDRVEKAIGDLIFSRSYSRYKSKNGKWFVGMEAVGTNDLLGGAGFNRDKKNEGNWDSFEACENKNFCMFLVNIDPVTGKTPEGGKAYWVEVGSNDSGTFKANFNPEKSRLKITSDKAIFRKLKVGQLIRGKGIKAGTVISELRPDNQVVRLNQEPVGNGTSKTLEFLGVGKRDPQCRVINTKMRHGGCFAGSTKIKMADGTERLVSAIAENDWLWNPHYQAPVRVKSVVKGPEKKALYEIVLSNKKVIVTEDHPFMTALGWVQAHQLKVGAKIVGSGISLRVNNVRKLKYEHPEDVWNFELDTIDPMGHLVLANGIPTGDLITQQLLKKNKPLLP